MSSAFPPSWQPSSGQGRPTNRLSASHLVGVILGCGGWPWVSWAQGSVLQKSLASPLWAVRPLSLSESLSWG